MRPAGLARGVSAYIATWVGGVFIAMLTGATAVVILLAIGFVAAVAAAVSGPFALRRATVHEVRTATVATAGDDLSWSIRATTPRPVFALVRIGDDEVAKGWLAPGETQLAGVAPRRGVHSTVAVAWSTPGRMGMLWWRRREGRVETVL